MANNSQFGLDIEAILNTKNVPKQMADLNAKLSKSTSTKIQIPITVNSKTGLQTLKNFVKEVNVYTDKLKNKFQEVKIFDPQTGKLWNNFDKITKVTEAAEGIKTLTTETHKFANTKGEIQTWTTSINNAGETIHTRSKQYIDDAGNMVKETSNWGRNAQGHWQQLGDTVKTVTETIKDITTTTSNQVGKINDLNKEYNGLITTTEKVSSNGEYLKTVVSKYTNEMGQAVEKTEQFDKVGNKVATTMRKISDSSKGNVEKGTSTLIDASGNKTIYQYADGVATLRTEVNQYKTALGGLVTVTSTYNEQTGELISKNREVTTDLQQQAQEAQKLAQYKKELVTTTLEEEQIITRSGQQYQAIVKTIEEETAKYGKLTTTITTYKDNLGRINVETRKTNEQGQEVAQTTRTITKELDKEGNSAKKAADSVNKYGESTRNAAIETKTFGQQLSDAFTRLLRYYVAQLPIQMVRKGIQETITTVKEFDSALIEFKKVSDLAGDSLTNYVSKLAEMGEVTGSTMQAMVEASTEFKKSGFSDEDSAKLASIAEMYRNIADEEISAADSASFIISQMKAFNIEASQTEHIIDAVNETSNNFAVSSADIATNLGKMSSAMAINGVTFEEQIGLLIGVTEITRNASSATRGLTMISSRLTQVLDDTSSTGKKLAAIYEKLGISIKDENGQLRSAYDILKDLSAQWDNLSENEQKYISLTSAGARQQNVFTSLMTNFNTVIEATATAYNSAGSAAKENEKVMDSVAKKFEILKSEFQQLVIGKGGLQEFVKKILDAATALVRFANSGLGKVLIKTTAIVGGITLLVRSFGSLYTWIIQAGRGLVTYALMLNGVSANSAIAATSTMGFKKSVSVLTSALIENAAAWAATPMGMATIAVAAIGSIVAALYLYNTQLERATEKTEELAEQSSQTESEIESLKSELENLATKIKNINENKLKITDEEELRNLQDQTLELEKQEESLKRQLALKLSLLEEQRREEEASARKTLNTTVGSEFANVRTSYGVAKEQVDPRTELARSILKYRELEKEIENYNQVIDKEIAANRANSDTVKDAQKHLDELGQEMERVQTRGTEMNEVVTTCGYSLRSQDEETQALRESCFHLSDVWNELIGVTNEVNEIIGQTTDEEQELEDVTEDVESSIEKLAETLGITATELEGLREKFDDFTLEKFLGELAEIKQNISDTSTVVDNLQDALKTAQTALEEYTETGYLTIDTFQSLMGISAQYLVALADENGQLEINQTTLGNLIEQLKIKKVQELAAAAATEIAANHERKVIAASEDAVISVRKIGSQIEDTGNKATIAAGQVVNFAKSVELLSGVNADDMTADDKKILQNYEKLAKEVAKWEVNLTSAGNAATTAGRKGASGAKQAKDATQELNKELEETKSQYEKVISFITGRIDKQTKAIKKQKDTEVDAIEKIIKAREKQKDKELDAIEEQINALEKEKDAREKYWDDQIDALKKANDERKDALELQEKLDALEKAKNTKVKIYKEGQGFVYDVDQTAVAEAQQALDEYLSEKAYEDELARLEALKDAEVNNYDQRLDALNQYKDNVQKSYEDQIAALEAQREALEEQYDAQIEYYNNFKEQFEDMVKAYEDKQTELLASQLTGINFENNNWMTRLDNLAKFVNEYNRLQEQLNTGNKNNTNNAQLSSGGGGGGTTPSTKSSTPTMTVKQREVTPQEREYMARVRHVGKTYASGTPSVKDNEIAIVGENPNQEIVIGSKINNGELMSLEKGTGVVNADSSKTIAGMLNQVGQFGSSGFGSGNGTLSNINNDSLTINGVTIQGANIKDPETFVNGLLNLKAEALQRAYRHR